MLPSATSSTTSRPEVDVVAEHGAADIGIPARDAAALSVEEVRARLRTAGNGLTTEEAATRLTRVGPNAVRTHHAQGWTVFVRQFHSPLLVLLVAAASISFFVGQRADAVIIGVIVSLSIGLGFVNEYRAERATEALHSQLRPRAVVRRDGAWANVDVTALVPGDVVRLSLGAVVPADVRLVSVVGLECDEAVLTGESMPVDKILEPVPVGSPVDSLASCALMGTIVHGGEGEAIVTATGAHTEFGRIALDLGERHEETEFQVGLRRFSLLLARVAAVLTGGIFVINLVLARPLIDALLFSLAIAVGITPQLLPAVVTTSLATGSRRLAQRKVLVKRLMCIEDLGDIEVLLTDKTGTLTEGRVTFERAVDVTEEPATTLLLLGVLCTAGRPGDEGTVTNPLDAALLEAPAGRALSLDRYRTIALAPFDHSRRRMSVLIDGPDGRLLITKGAPEQLLTVCREVSQRANQALQAEFARGGRVIAVGYRAAPELDTVAPEDEHDLELAGFLVFVDQPKQSATAALSRLSALGITVRIVTGDNAHVAERVCEELGLVGGGTLNGDEIDVLDDDALMARLSSTRVFARVDPEQKTRIIRLHRHSGQDVAYLGDGVNDAVALHAADVGISVDTAAEVARNAAGIVLLEKDLGVLADGVVEGRRIFANTIKYVLMGTSSNFGNMFSAAAASAFLTFLPMLPSQILLNNLLYDAGQMAIPSDRVDEEQLARPSHWDIGFIRRFMLFFGPISSMFDFLTFAVMVHLFNAGPELFRSGWFVESLATQTLVIFVIRTRRSPFWRSRPGRLITVAALSVVAIGAALPFLSIGSDLGFVPLPAGFFAVLGLMVVAYLALVELGKREFFAHVEPGVRPLSAARSSHERRVRRRAAAFSHKGTLSRS
jgi:Mg2+-importing ATPase